MSDLVKKHIVGFPTRRLIYGLNCSRGNSLVILLVPEPLHNGLAVAVPCPWHHYIVTILTSHPDDYPGQTAPLSGITRKEIYKI